MDITRDVMRMRAEGRSKAETRAAIERTYLSYGAPTATPPPPTR